MTTTSFAGLSARAQVARLRPLALEALKAYSIEVAKLRLLNHGFNTMFRVDDVSGRRFAFRINVNSRRTTKNVRAEIAWLQVLQQDTDLRVPEVIAARDGSFMQSVSVDGLPLPVPAVLFGWLPGPNLEERLSVPAVEAWGGVMAQLHQHAAQFRLPEGADLFTADNVLYNLPNAFETAEAAFMPAHRLEIFRQGLQATQAVLNAVFAAGGAPRVIHTDLHEGNLKWSGGRLSVFDFDDCAFGQPAQDIATAIRSLATEDDFPAHRAALERGYTQLAPWPVQTERELEGLVVARGLLLANDVLLTLNPELREVIPGFLTKLEAQVQRFLETA